MSPINDPTHNGREYWRNLQELANSPEIADSLEHEFTGYNPDELSGAAPGAVPGAVPGAIPGAGLSRRSFVKIMGASMALAGVTATGCRRWPQQKVMPYANRPSGREPNTRQHYASMLQRGGVAQALLVTTFEGRPIKLEGNPEHPISMGTSDAMAQASLLEMYDPQRTRVVEHDGSRASWDDFTHFISDQFRGHGTGEGVAILCEANNSPTLAALKKKLQTKHNSLTWTTWESLHRDSEVAGARHAFGRELRAQYHLDQANIIVSLDADLLGQHPGMLKHARDWAAGRRSADSDHKMNRLYAIESTLTATGSVADTRIPVRHTEIGTYAANILKALKGQGVDKTVEGIVADLKENAGHALVVAGPSQSAAVHERVWQINDALGAIGKTVTLIDEPDYDRDLTTQIGELVSQINGGKVKTLIIIGGNPVFDAPAELNFADALNKVEHTAHLTLYANETTGLCDWHLPRTHDLEAWGDGQSWDGTHCLRQPMIYPLFEGRSEIQLAAMLVGDADSDGEKLVRANVEGGDLAWRQNVQRGFVEGSAAKSAGRLTPKANVISISAAKETDFELIFAADASVFDGRHAVNGWMQETPDPLTKLTWDNAAMVNIADARQQGIEHGDLIKITAVGQTIEIAAYLMPGQARGTITLPLGYGREAAGHVGTKVGFNVAPLRTTATQYVATGATISNTGQSYKLATTQNHYLIDWIGARSIRQRVGDKGKSGVIIKETTLDHYIADKDFANRNKHSDVRLQMYESPMQFNDPHAWGMTIDMTTCIGCNACVLACQSENNIPIVGKDQVLVSREMQWLRIDRYFKTDPKDTDAQNPGVVHMPMMCQHCENAPCEEVCPVAATMHDSEGLNTMVYNRCIGTRYCANNCPYKVRRFNYFDYHAKDSRGSAKPWLGIPDQEQAGSIDPIKQMVFNPDVTVRMRGVMEKCSYCTQRIARAKSEARIEQVKAGEHQHRTLADGDVVTACEQACPTQAIVFGNLNDRESRVVTTQKNDRAYEVLDNLNTRPRTKYLALLRNPQKI